MEFDKLEELLQPKTDRQAELVRQAIEAGVTIAWNPTRFDPTLDRFVVTIPGAGVINVLSRQMVFHVLATALQPA